MQVTILTELEEEENNTVHVITVTVYECFINVRWPKELATDFWAFVRKSDQS